MRLNKSAKNLIPAKAIESSKSLEYCTKWFKKNNHIENIYFTKSCTQSLELSLLLLDLPANSEVIIPSYAFVSLGNAVNNLGIKCVYVDCEGSTMNIDVNQIEQAITENTKALITINYGGISCDYDKIRKICRNNNLILIEDNAHGILGKYKDEFLGTIGDISCFSFDHLKNFSCFQGGAIAINNKSLLKKFFIAYEFGTNRRDLFEGVVDHYEWQGKGTNSIIAPPLLTILKGQLDNFKHIISLYNNIWRQYQTGLAKLAEKKHISLVQIPDYCTHNAHMFWIKTKSKAERTKLIAHLANNNINSASHYSPLHTSRYGKTVGNFKGGNNNTSIESEKILRLPMHLKLTSENIKSIIGCVEDFYS
tara:strand:+ start:34481 stop:35575 length:1095 start_codon:yes stop_codon:yes gene_type:complete